MPAKCENIQDALKSLIAAFWITFSVCSVGVDGQEGKKNILLLTLFDKITNVTRGFISNILLANCYLYELL